MKSKTGLHYKMDSAYWIPGFGLRMGGLEVYQSESGLLLSEMSQLQVRIHWGALLKGDLAVSNVTAVEPKFQFSEEQVITFLKKFKPLVPPKPDPGALALNSNKPIPVPKTPKRSQTKPTTNIPSPTTKPAPKHTGQKPVTQTKPKAIPKSPIKPRPKPSPKKSFLENLELKNASFIISKAEGAAYIELHGVDVKLPMSEEKGGELNIKELKGVGEYLIKGFSAELKLVENGIELHAEEQDVGKANCIGVAKLDKFGNFALSGGGALKPGSPVFKEFKWGEFELTGAILKGNLQGNIRSPESWRGIGKFSSEEARLNHPSKTVDFDRTEMNWTLERGEMIIHQINCDSAELKVRGYTGVNIGGDIAGTVRVIGTQDAKENVQRFFHAIRLGFPMKNFPLTEDIFFNDVFLKGKLWNPSFKTGKNWVNLKERLKQTDKFLDAESKEELNNLAR